MRARFFVLLYLLFLHGHALAIDPAEGRMEEGAREFGRGTLGEAAAAWKEAASLFAKAKLADRQADALLNLGQAYHALGQRRLAMESLEQALTLTTTPGRQMRIKAALGAVCAFSRRDERAENLLRESLEAARQLGDKDAVASILNDLGNLLAAQARTGDAIRAYEESAAKRRPTHCSRPRPTPISPPSLPTRQTAAKANRRALRALAQISGLP